MTNKFIVIPIVVDGDGHTACSVKCDHADFWLYKCRIFMEDIFKGRCEQCIANSLYSKSALKYFQGVTSNE